MIAIKPQWIRTYPAGTPDDLAATGRQFIMGGLPQHVTMDHDYRPVLAGLGVPTLITEWDIAVSQEGVRQFLEHVQRLPGRVHVAPYLLYPVSTGWDRPVFAHRRGNLHGAYRWITREDSYADLFGFGMVYLPQQTITDYLSETDGITTDATFSLWHHNSGRDPAIVHWGVDVIHLHY